MTEKIGLQAVLETEEFQAGLQAYLKGLQEAQKATDFTAKALDQAGLVWDENAQRWRDAAGQFKSASDATKAVSSAMASGVSEVSDATADAGSSVSSFSGVLSALGPEAIAIGAALGGAVVIIKEVAEAFIDATVAAAEFIGESTKLASRWEELGLVAQLMGQRFGLSAQEVTNLIEEMKEAGIRADIASESISQFTRMEMDPRLALNLGKAAQNFAVLAEGGADSSETLERLMIGIQRLSPLMLRNAGATVHLQGAYEAYAKELGKAQDDLTTVDKQQAAYNAVMAQAAKITGVYEVSMQTAAKQMRSLTGREIPTLKNAFGEPFQEAFRTFASSLRTLVNALTEAVSEGGALYPIMVNLGAIASIVADGFEFLVDKFTSWLKILDLFNTKAPETKKSSQALMKGAAEGIKEGSGDVTREVTDTVTDVTDIFMDAVENSVKWGADLIFGFADGIVKGASTVLVWAMNSISNVLTSWLKGASPPKVAPDIVKWGADAMTEFLKGFTKADFSALKDLQGPLKNALGILVDIGKITAKDAAEAFIGMSMDLADALSGGNIDESLFDRIAQEAGQFGEEIAELARQQFVLADATEQVAEVQERLNDALKQEEEAEKTVRSLISEYNRMLRAGASDDILKAKLAEINAADEQAVQAREQRLAAEEELESKKETLDILKEQVSLQKQLVDQLLQLAKEAIIPGVTPEAPAGGGAKEETGLEELGGLEGIEIDPEGIKSKIGEIVGLAKEEMINRWQELWDDIKELFQERFGESLAAMSEAWQNFSGVIGEVWEQKIRPVFEAVKEWVATNLPAAWDALKEKGEEVWAWYVANMIPTLEAIWQIIKDIGSIIKEWFRPQWEAADILLRAIFDFLGLTGIPTLKELWENLDLATAATLGWQMMLDSLASALEWVREKLEAFHLWLTTIKDALAGMPHWEDMKTESPPPLAQGISMVNSQLAELANQLMPAVASQISGLNSMSLNPLQPAMASSSVIAPSSSRTMNLNQTNHIQSPMDLATFQAMFNQVIRNQFAGV